MLTNQAGTGNARRSALRALGRVPAKPGLPVWALLKRALLLALACQVGLAGSKAADPESRAQASALAGTGPRLAYVTASGQGSFDLMMADPVNQTIEKVESLLSRPALVVWRIDRHQVITVTGDGVIAIDLGHKPFAAAAAGEGPPDGVHIQDGWIARDGVTLQVVAWQADARGHAVCALYRVPAPEGEWQRQSRPVPVEAEDGCRGFADEQRVRGLSISSAALQPQAACTGFPVPCGAAADAQVAVRGRLALVAGANEASDPVVVDLDSGKPVFSARGLGAVWVPEGPPAH